MVTIGRQGDIEMATAVQDFALGESNPLVLNEQQRFFANSMVYGTTDCLPFCAPIETNGSAKVWSQFYIVQHGGEHVTNTFVGCFWIVDGESVKPLRLTLSGTNPSIVPVIKTVIVPSGVEVEQYLRSIETVAPFAFVSLAGDQLTLLEDTYAARVRVPRTYKGLISAVSIFGEPYDIWVRKDNGDSVDADTRDWRSVAVRAE